jgi:hypothetical protein
VLVPALVGNQTSVVGDQTSAVEIKLVWSKINEQRIKTSGQSSKRNQQNNQQHNSNTTLINNASRHLNANFGRSPR